MVAIGHKIKCLEGTSYEHEREVMPNLRMRLVGREGPGRNMSHHELKQLLGLPPKLPKHAVAAMEVGNVTVWVNEARPGPLKHRVMCECPDCGATVPAGRLSQQKCKPQ